MVPSIWQGKSVLVTGHTGFKGSWLALCLLELGAKVSGFALPPKSSPNHWNLLRLDVVRQPRRRPRLRPRCHRCLTWHNRRSCFISRHSRWCVVPYRDPLETWSTNVMGTAHVLESCRRTESVRAIVVVTTDKVYANQEWSRGYREDDRLGRPRSLQCLEGRLRTRCRQLPEIVLPIRGLAAACFRPSGQRHRRRGLVGRSSDPRPGVAVGQRKPLEIRCPTPRGRGNTCWSA